MHKRIHILYGLLWVAYAAFALTMFPRWNTNVAFVYCPMIALGAWLYGSTTGLLLIILAGSIHFVLCSQLYADIALYYEDRFAGTLIVIAIALLSGHIRKSLDAVKEANTNLDRMVQERSRKLEALASKLVAKAEKMRVLRGQLLHDGIGQQLAGIQLFSTSLAEQLVGEQNPNASLGFALRNRAGATHQQIRGIARFLFPVRIGEVGLGFALEELADCFREMKQVEFSVTAPETLADLPDAIALQLYRVCQETVTHAFDKGGATRFRVEVDSTGNGVDLHVCHNGVLRQDMANTIEKQLLEYRLRQISATRKEGVAPDGSISTTFSVPMPALAGAEI